MVKQFFMLSAKRFVVCLLISVPFLADISAQDYQPTRQNAYPSRYRHSSSQNQRTQDAYFSRYRQSSSRYQRNGSTRREYSNPFMKQDKNENSSKTEKASKRGTKSEEYTKQISSSIPDNKSADDVVLVVTGDGRNKNEAIMSALRSGIEQSFGAFVSSDTRILNDNVVKDEIISISSGNVKKYEVISEGSVGSRYFVSVKMLISVNNLVNYAMSKGASVELSGATTLVMNTKLKKMNQKNAIKAMCSFEEQIIDLLPSCFDYSIELKEPTSRDNYTSYVWPTIIRVTVNSNINAIHHKLSKIQELNKTYFGYLDMDELLWSLREKALSFIMGGMTIKDDFGTYTFKEKVYDSFLKNGVIMREADINRSEYIAWGQNCYHRFISSQFDYVGGEGNALAWAGSKRYKERLTAFKYNFFYYADPIETLSEYPNRHYHVWYNHDNRFFIPKDENYIDYQVYANKTDHGFYLPQFSKQIITLTTPIENSCVLSFPLTMFYNEEELMKAKTISIYFEMSDEERQKIRKDVDLVIQRFLKW